MLSFSTLLSIF